MTRRAIAVLGAAGVALALAGCGGQPEADVANGKTQYVACAGCHALADANAKGGPPIGGIPVPSLDDAFRGARQNGWEDSQIRGVVARWIREPAAPMPADIVKGQDVEDVAAYVASVAGKDEESPVTKITPLPPIVEPGGLAPGEGEAAAAGGGGEATAGGAIPVDADPAGGLKFVQTTLTAPAGEVTLELKNESAVPHNIAVRGNGVDSDVSDTIQGGTATASLTVPLEAGEYEFYCAVPGHFEAGMKGTLTVE
jgi:plastocyanin/mono/diheme cytochrome c family protein